MSERGQLSKSGSNAGYGAVGSSAQEDPEPTGPPADLYDPNEVRGWRGAKYRCREYFAEFLGTFVLCTLGIGGIAQTVLSRGFNGSWITIAFSFGLGLTLAIAAVGRVSSHYNPAVTITMAVYRGFPLLKVPGYIFAQTLGAFCAAFVIFITYYEAIDQFDGGHREVKGENATAGIFATYPQSFNCWATSFFSEALGTFFLIFVILAVTDEKNREVAPAAPFLIGITLFVIAIALGFETGFALNGARDFGPRLFTLLAGYGFKVLTADHWYFWIPLVAPVTGGLVAGFTYDFLIYTGRSPLNRG